MHQCPDFERLSKLVGPSEEVFPGPVRSHVEGCAECRRAFESRGDVGGYTPRVGGAFEAPAGAAMGRTVADAGPPGGEVPFLDTNLFETYSSEVEEDGLADADTPPPAGLSTFPIASGMPFQAGGVFELGRPEVPGYEVLSRLGQGGMGVVYKARQKQLNRLVALKMIRDVGRAGPQQLARFRIEAEAVARLRHPNIVQIYEIGEVEGLPFFSLELLEGGGLDARLAGIPQPRRESAEMVATLASAIQAAHQARVIHRDLKPANVVLAADGTPKVTDFGLAKRLEEEGSDTKTGEIMGSPSYMSPEQARGKLELVGPSADIYALGAILYEMLTGRPPFRGATSWETVRLVIEEEPVPPSRLRPRIPRDLETICLKCLQKEPHRRYPTARELADDLRRFLADEPIRARPIPFWERGIKWARRRPAVASLSALAAALFAVLVGSGLWYAQLVRQREAEQANRNDETYLVGLNELAAGKLEARDGHFDRARLRFEKLGESLNDLGPRARRETRFLDLSRRIKDQLQAASAAASAASAAASDLEERARFYRGLKDFEKLRDEALFLEADFTGLDLSGRGLSGGPVGVGPKADRALDVFAVAGPGGVRSLASLPAWLPLAERASIAEDCYELLLIRAEAEARRRPGDDPKPRAEAALRLLDSAASLRPDATRTLAFRRRRASYLEALGRAPEAAREREEAGRLGPRDALDHLLLGRDLARQGDLPSAIVEFGEVLKADPGRFWAKCLLAIAELRAGEPNVARVLLDECIRDQPGSAWLLLLRGYARGQAGLAALERARRGPDRGAEAVAPGSSSRPSPDRPPAPGTLAGSMADFDDAEADFAAALEALGPDDKLLHYAILLDRGLVRFWRGRDEEARADFRQALALDGDRYNAHVNLAGVAWRRGEYAEAIARLTQPIAKLTAAPDLKPDPAALVPLHRFRGYVYARRSDLARGSAGRISGMARLVGRLDPVAGGGLAGLSWAVRRLEKGWRKAALADLDDILEGPSKVAGDLAKRAELHFRTGRHLAALTDAEAALRLDPTLPSAHRWRLAALLELGRPGEVIKSCDAYLAVGKTSAELYAIRGQARAKGRDLEGAIEDYTLSLAARPGQVSVLVDRGWARLGLGEPAPALHDFEQAIRIDPSNGDAFSGRGNARAARGKTLEALADAAEALRLGKPTPLKLYRCARIHAHAWADEIARAARDARPDLRVARAHRVRAAALLREAYGLLSPVDRQAYRGNVASDPYFRSIPLPADLLPRREPRPRDSAARLGKRSSDF